MRRLAYFITALVFSLSASYSPVLAVDETFYSNNDILFYEPNACAATTTSNVGGDGSLPDWVGMPTTINASAGGPVNGVISAVAANTRDYDPFPTVINKITQRDPDFISLNEVANEPLSRIERLAPGYGAWREETRDQTRGNSDQSINNVMMWKKDSWELLDKGRIKVTEDDQVVFKGDNKTWDRFATWGVFKRKSDNAVVSFVSTHFMTNPAKGKQWGDQPFTRIDQYRLSMEILIHLTEVLGQVGPVIVGGDMNTHGNEGDWAAIPMMKAAGFIWSSENDVLHIFSPKGTKIIDNRRITDLPLSGDHSNGAEYAKIQMNGVGPGGSVGSLSSTSESNSCTCAAPDISSVGDLDAFLKALAKQESGGNPTAANPGSSARGKYQYITGTWQARKSLYPPSGAYSTADKAPEAVQDAVAYIEYAQKWKEFNGDLFKLAVSHFYPAANSDPSLLDQHIGPSSNPTPREYANSVVEKIKNGYGSDIPLHYKDAPEFQKYLDKAVGADFNGGGSGGGGSEGCESGNETVSEGGLTEEQAKKLTMNYGANKNNDTAQTIGSSYWADCSPGGKGSNCVSFSRFFINKFSNKPAPTPMGDGKNVVSNMAAAGFKTGSKPKPYAIFSWSNSGYGHTGVVLGIHGDTIIVGHASCTRGRNGISGRGDGTEGGGGSAFIMIGKLNSNSAFWGTKPSGFAYPDVDVNKIQDYVNGKI
jgi:surface antigen